MGLEEGEREGLETGRWRVVGDGEEMGVNEGYMEGMST